MDYFDRKVYLAQSPQFYKQIMVPVFERVACVDDGHKAAASALDAGGVGNEPPIAGAVIKPDPTENGGGPNAEMLI